MSCYLNPLVACSAYIVLLFIGGDLSFLGTVIKNEPLVCLIFVFSGCIALPQQVLKIVAAKHTPASKLAIY